MSVDVHELEQWRVLRPRSRWSPAGFAQLWSYRGLGAALTARDIRLRYRQTLFGVAWAVLQPLAGMLLFSLIFGNVVGAPSDGMPYPVFVLAGLVFWTFMSSAVTAAAESLVEHRELVTKVWFPRALAPLAAVAAATLDLAIALALLAVVQVAYGVGPGLALVTLPLWLLAALLVAAGAGLVASAANVLYRDARYVLGFGLQLWLFASPVVFPISSVDSQWRWLLALNPATGVIEGGRWALLDGPAPGSWIAVCAGALVTLVLCGLIIFAAAERSFADRI